MVVLEKFVLMRALLGEGGRVEWAFICCVFRREIGFGVRGRVISV